MYQILKHQSHKGGIFELIAKFNEEFVKNEFIAPVTIVFKSSCLSSEIDSKTKRLSRAVYTRSHISTKSIFH